MEHGSHSIATENPRSWPQSIAEFELLIDALQQRLVRFAYFRLGSLADAEDVTQDVLVQAYRDRAAHRRVDNAAPFLFRMVANRCTDLLRKRQREVRFLSEAPAPCGGWTDSDARMRWIEGLLDRLPRRQAEVIRLRVYGELPFEAVAQAVGCSVPTVKSRFRYGIQKLRSALEKQGGTV